MRVGTDIIEIEKIKRILSFDSARAFSLEEQKYCNKFPDPLPHFAGMWAVKESVKKAFGGDIEMLDINIVHMSNGEPRILINEAVQRQLDKYSLVDIEISLSHDGAYSTAICIIM